MVDFLSKKKKKNYKKTLAVRIFSINFGFWWTNFTVAFMFTKQQQVLLPLKKYKITLANFKSVTEFILALAYKIMCLLYYFNDNCYNNSFFTLISNDFSFIYSFFLSFTLLERWFWPFFFCVMHTYVIPTLLTVFLFIGLSLKYLQQDL